MAKILIVEDNQGTNKAICEYMKEAGHTLFSAFTGSEALKIFREKELDIIVLDIMLPEMSGIVVLHEIRKISNIPVIMLTALDDEYTQSNSFDEMADDYITKPFSMLILGKRITALLRRSQNKPAVNTVKLGDITVDFSGYTASDENGKIDITPKELEILKVLIDNRDGDADNVSSGHGVQKSSGFGGTPTSISATWKLQVSIHLPCLPLPRSPGNPAKNGGSAVSYAPSVPRFSMIALIIPSTSRSSFSLRELSRISIRFFAASSALISG